MTIGVNNDPEKESEGAMSEKLAHALLRTTGQTSFVQLDGSTAGHDAGVWHQYSCPAAALTAVAKEGVRGLSGH